MDYFKIYLVPKEYQLSYGGNKKSLIVKYYKYIIYNDYYILYIMYLSIFYCYLICLFNCVISYRKLPIIIANWKMNTNLDTSINLASYLLKNKNRINNVDVVILPPLPFITNVKNILNDTSIFLGSQNVYHQTNGAYTGKISVFMLDSIGCKYVLVGHSERRLLCSESDEDINMVMRIVHKTNMVPILCIGETKNEYDLDIQNEIITIQLTKNLNGLSNEEIQNTIIAYEPIWSIGTGIPMDYEKVQKMHSFIRDWITQKYGCKVGDNIRILYGGSVRSNNIKELFKCEDVDGFLVGTSSLYPDEFMDIIDSCRYYS